MKNIRLFGDVEHVQTAFSRSSFVVVLWSILQLSLLHFWASSMKDR